MDRELILQKWPWALIQLPSSKGGLFEITSSTSCDELPKFFEPSAKEAFDTGTPTVVDLFPTKEAAEQLLQNLSPEVAQSLWMCYRNRGLI